MLTDMERSGMSYVFLMLFTLRVTARRLARQIVR